MKQYPHVKARDRSSCFYQRVYILPEVKKRRGNTSREGEEDVKHGRKLTPNLTFQRSKSYARLYQEEKEEEGRDCN